MNEGTSDARSKKWWHKKIAATRDKAQQWVGLFKNSYFGRNLIVQGMYFGRMRYWLYSLMMPKKVSEIGRDESSRKYVYKLRKLFTMYAKCLGMTGDLDALQLLRKFVSKHEPWKSCLEDVSLMVLGEHLQEVAKNLVEEGLQVPRLERGEEEGNAFTLELPEVNPSGNSVHLLKKVFDVCMETALRPEAPERAL